MTKKTKMVLAAIVGLMALVGLLTHASFDYTREMTSCSSCSASSNSAPTGNELRLFHKIAIVAPEAKSADVRLGNLVASKLKQKLDGKFIAERCYRGKHHLESYEAKAEIFRTAGEARRSGADFYYTVQVKDYRYSFWPFAKDWNANVVIYASTKGVHVGNPVITGGRSRYGTLDTSLAYDCNGRMVGLFSSSYLTHKIAEELVSTALKEVNKQAGDMVYETMYGNKPKKT